MKLYLAPLHGVTNRVFRKVYFDHFSGFDAALAPFILAVNNDQLGDKHFKDLLQGKDEKVPLIPQLLWKRSNPLCQNRSVPRRTRLPRGELESRLPLPDGRE